MNPFLLLFADVVLVILLVILSLTPYNRLKIFYVTAIVLIAIGAIPQNIVIISNDFKMPYDSYYCIEKECLTHRHHDYTPITQHTKFWYLGDVIYTGFALTSIGDIFIFMGGTIWFSALFIDIFENVKQWRKKKDSFHDGEQV